MRLALLSDLHGNPIALDAVLADIDAMGGVDGYLVLGDLVAIGHDPAGVLERLVRLPGAPARSDDEVIALFRRRLAPIRNWTPAPAAQAAAGASDGA